MRVTAVRPYASRYREWLQKKQAADEQEVLGVKTYCMIRRSERRNE